MAYHPNYEWPEIRAEESSRQERGCIEVSIWMHGRKAIQVYIPVCESMRLRRQLEAAEHEVRDSYGGYRW